MAMSLSLSEDVEFYEEESTCTSFSIDKSCSHSRDLLRFDEIPDEAHWLRDNECIVTAYRPACCGSCSIKHGLQSLFEVHNESGNIWTHLFASLAVVFIAVHFYATHPGLSMLNQLSFLVFFFSALSVFGFSCIFHTFLSSTFHGFKVLSRLDYAGISFHLAGANAAAVQFEFWCDTKWSKIYTLLFAVGFAVLLLIITIDQFDTPQFRAMRGITFIGFGVLFSIHLFHRAWLYREAPSGGIWWYTSSAMLYLLCGIVFATRFPEAIWPGKFDIIGHSHQVFHCICIVACWLWLQGLTRAFDHRMSNQCPAIPPQSIIPYPADHLLNGFDWLHSVTTEILGLTWIAEEL